MNDDRPKLPSGFDTWLDFATATDTDSTFKRLAWAQKNVTENNPQGLEEYAAAELAELRNKLESQEKEIERLRRVMREPPHSDVGQLCPHCQWVYDVEIVDTDELAKLAENENG